MAKPQEQQPQKSQLSPAPSPATPSAADIASMTSKITSATLDRFHDLVDALSSDKTINAIIQAEGLTAVRNGLESDIEKNHKALETILSKLPAEQRATVLSKAESALNAQPATTSTPPSPDAPSTPASSPTTAGQRHPAAQGERAQDEQAPGLLKELKGIWDKSTLKWMFYGFWTQENKTKNGPIKRFMDRWDKFLKWGKESSWNSFNDNFFLRPGNWSKKDK